nr:BA14K family protein [Sinorhizobium fredii]
MLAGLCGFALSLALFLSGAAVATFILNGNPAREPRLDMNQSEIWAEQPRAVNTAAQQYERLPARAAPADVSGSEPVVTAKDIESSEDPASKSELTTTSNGSENELLSEPLDMAPTGSIQTATSEEQPALETRPTAHVDWCANRYRSYRASDNSYRSFSGGRRTCISPYMNAAGTPSEDVLPPPAPAENLDASSTEMDFSADASGVGNLSLEHVDYCFSRYRSYRPEDNTYQPFDGGPRRQCR